VAKLYLIGSLRNPEIPKIANELRELGFDVFDDWFAAGPEADDKWKEYEETRGRSFSDALNGEAARHVFGFDFQHLSVSDVVVLVLPAGKSGHLELGWALGRHKRGYILHNNPDRWDVMYKFAHGVYYSLDELKKELVRWHSGSPYLIASPQPLRSSSPVPPVTEDKSSVVAGSVAGSSNDQTAQP